MDISLIANGSILLFSILSLAALAGYFCEKVGIVNIGIDGQMIFGALTFSIFAQLLSPLSQYNFILPMLISMILSLLLSSLFGFLTIKLKCNHVISGTAINLLMAGIGIFITEPLGSLISHGTTQKITPGYFSILKIGDTSLYAGSIIIAIVAIIIVVACWFVINKTRMGLRFKAVGENPNAVDAQGISVNRLKWKGVLISGALSSLAGAIFSYAGPDVMGGGIQFEGNVSGLGFLALAIVVAGSWKIPVIVIMSLIFAILTKVFDSLNQIVDGYDYIKQLGRAIPFLLSLITLVIFSKRSVAPSALGQHFDKSMR